MCYDVNFKSNIESILNYLPDLILGQTTLNTEIYARAHIQAQAHLPYPIVYMNEGKKTLDLMEWGIIAPYMDTPEKIKKTRPSMCNIRSEKILEKGSYWNRIRKNRCLIPVIGIYEHRKVEGFKTKIPYHVQLKSQPMFFLPGLYAEYADLQTGELKKAYGIVTRAANKVMKQIHNDSVNGGRMPLFLTLEQSIQWLIDTSDEAIIKTIAFEMPSEELDFCPVHTIRTSKPRADGKDKNEAFNWGVLPTISV